jgi:uncharacterized membrane protein
MAASSAPEDPPPPSTLQRLSAIERRVMEAVVGGQPVSRDTYREFIDTRTLGERVADGIAAFGGSWTFILLFLAVLIAWITLNAVLLAPHGRAFDPYPFILLNLALSLVAALQAPVIMMSQNRQGARDRLEAAHDYEVNLKAEIEIQTLHAKLDQLREHEWAELVALQQEQIRLLERLLERTRADGAGEPR